MVGLFEKVFVLRLDFLQFRGKRVRSPAQHQQGGGTGCQRDRQGDGQQDQSCGSGYEMRNPVIHQNLAEGLEHSSTARFPGSPASSQKM
jgi:hypothetical protein